MNAIKEKRLKLEDILVAVRDATLTPRQQQRKGASFVGARVDWMLSFFDVSELSTGKESLMFKHPDMWHERVFVIADPYPEIEHTHRGALLRVRGVITHIDELGVHLCAEEIIF